MTTSSGSNFTGLYGSSSAVIPSTPYGNANVVGLLAAGTDGGNTITAIVATGNISTTAQISATGNITTAGYFVGDIVGNVTGNVTAAGSNTQVQYNNNGLLGADSDFTFNSVTSALAVTGNITGGNVNTGGVVSAAGNINGGNVNATANVTATGVSVTGNVTAAYFLGNIANASGVYVNKIFNGTSEANIGTPDGNANISIGGTSNVAVFTPTGLTVTANVTGGNINTNSIKGNADVGNLTVRNSFSGSGLSTGANILLDAQTVLVGSTNAGLSQNAVVQASLNNTLQLTTTNTGAPSVYVGKYVSGNPTYTGNLDLVTSNVGGYGGTGNVNLSGNVYVGRAGQGANATYGLANLIVSDNVYVSGTVSVTGNINGGNIKVGNVAAFDSTSVTLEVGGWNAVPRGRVVSSTFSPSVITDAVSFLLPGTTLGPADANIAAGNILSQNSIQALGAITANGNVLAGNISTGGLISATGNVTGGNLTTAGQVSATGNITGNYYIGNGSLLTGITANVSSNSISNGTSNVTIGSSGGNIDVWIGGNQSGLWQSTGLEVFGFINTSGNIEGSNVNGAVNLTGGNVISTGLISSAGNITASANIAATYYTGNARFLTGIQATIGGNLSANLDGNGFGANAFTIVNSTGNLWSTQQTVVGTANTTGGTGNIFISGKNIATDMAWNPDGGNAATGSYGRVVIGTGFNGNINHAAQQNRLVVADSITRSNTATTVRGFNSEQFVSLTGNVVQNNFRQQALGGYVRVGGGSAANTASSAGSTGGVPFLFASGQFNLDIGNFATYNLGNTTVSHATLNGGALTVGGASTVANAFGIYNLVNNTSATANAYGNIIGYSTSIAGGATGSPPSGNVYAFYHPATTATYGPSTSATVQAAPQYYAFYNADDHAQVKLGSLSSYNEFRYTTATSGTVNINKNNAQVQYIAPTGNVTIGDFQNFVTRTVTTYETDYQTDTVTLIIQQGATPYTVTMPTGNTSIRYANSTSTVGANANTTTMISVTGYYNGSGNTYLVTVSPEFT